MAQKDDNLTRAERREQARADRRALEAKQKADAIKKKRLIALGSVLAVIVVALAIIFGTTSGGSSNSGLAKGAQATQTVAEVSSLLQGIPQSSNVLGNPNAPITLQYFGDLKCPICQEFTADVLPTLIQDYVKTGKMKIEYHSLMTASAPFGSQMFQNQQVAALAAGAQNKAWDYIELFYHEQGDETVNYANESFLDGLAAQVPGLNLAQWQKDRSNPAYAKSVSADAQTAAQNNLTGTPSFLVSAPGILQKVFTPQSFTDPSSYVSAFNSLG